MPENTGQVAKLQQQVQQLTKKLTRLESDYDIMANGAKHDLKQQGERIYYGIREKVHYLREDLATMIQMVIDGEREPHRLATPWNQFDHILAEAINTEKSPVKKAK